MKATTTPTQPQAPAAPLCPACAGPVVRIDTSVEVKYLVHYAITAKDLEIIAEQVGDCEWDEHTAAHCDACGWHGTVGDLLAER